MMRDRIWPSLAVAAATLLAATGCGGDASAVTASSRGTQYIVGIDISGSRKPMDLRESQTLLQNLVSEKMSYGDKIVFIEMYGAKEPQQFRDSVKALHSTEPSPREKRELEDFRTRTLSILPMFFDSTRIREVTTTDVFGTLFRAADYSHSPGHDKTVLLLLSDMIQATDELNMEKESNIPGPEWIKALGADQRLPDLTGTCVLVSGADTKSARGARARQFWMDYFEHVGAKLRPEHYRGLIADASQLGCS
jgi:hypothetical protein